MMMSHMTALEEFKVLLKEHLGPSLRELGWKGSGASWVRPHPTHWVLLGWQKSRDSSAASVEFTCNLKVISKDVWDAENIPHGRRPERPSTATTWFVGWEERLGSLIPGSGGDRWWFVRPGDDLAGIAREAMSAVTAYGLPAVDRQLAAAALESRRCWHNVGGRNWFEPCRRPAEIELRLGDRMMFRCREHAEAARKELA